MQHLLHPTTCSIVHNAGGVVYPHICMCGLGAARYASTTLVFKIEASQDHITFEWFCARWLCRPKEPLTCACCLSHMCRAAVVHRRAHTQTDKKGAGGVQTSKQGSQSTSTTLKVDFGLSEFVSWPTFLQHTLGRSGKCRHLPSLLLGRFSRFDGRSPVRMSQAVDLLGQARYREDILQQNRPMTELL